MPPKQKYRHKMVFDESGRIGYERVPVKHRAPKPPVDARHEEMKAWARAGQQYAGNIFGLPSLNQNHAPGPGPVARGITSASTHLPVTNKPHPPARPPGPGPSARVRKATTHRVQHYVVGSAPNSLYDTDAIMASPKGGKPTMRPIGKRRRKTVGPVTK